MSEPEMKIDHQGSLINPARDGASLQFNLL
jgi:hypothetical protein